MMSNNVKTVLISALVGVFTAYVTSHAVIYSTYKQLEDLKDVRILIKQQVDSLFQAQLNAMHDARQQAKTPAPAAAPMPNTPAAAPMPAPQTEPAPAAPSAPETTPSSM